MIHVTIQETGFKRIDANLGEMAGRVKSFLPCWDSVIKVVREEEEKIFQTEGSESGAKWAPLTPKYAKRKMKKYGAKPILQATGKLKTSVAGKGWGANVLLERQGGSLRIGSRLHYGFWLQTGTRKMVARPFMRLTARAKKDVVEIMRRFVTTGRV